MRPLLYCRCISGSKIFYCPCSLGNCCTVDVFVDLRSITAPNHCKSVLKLLMTSVGSTFQLGMLYTAVGIYSLALGFVNP